MGLACLLKKRYLLFLVPGTVSPEFSIIINGQRLYAARQVKYLGVTFQWSGSVSKHVHSISSRPFGPLTYLNCYHGCPGPTSLKP